jgi:hypothetical protein
MDQVEPAAFDAMADRAPTDSTFEQLASRNDAVLALRERRNHSIDRSRLRFGPHFGPNVR